MMRVTIVPITVQRNPDISDDADSRGNSIANLLVLFWMCGVIILGKRFAYLSVGPIYITELTLVVLIVSNFWRITTKDYFLIGAVLFYAAGGILKGYDWFFVIKDICFMYYLLFMRFFPKDFPGSYMDIVLKACFLRMAMVYISPLILGLSGINILALTSEKYGDGVVILFLAGYFAMRDPGGRVSPGAMIALALMAYICDYKTAMIAIAALPLSLAAKDKIVARINFGSVSIFMITILAVTYSRGSHALLVWFVDLLNVAMDVVGSSRTYSTGTAIWRAEIWSQAVTKLYSVPEILFGQFPGFNFINSNFLGIKSFFLSGGDGLGTLRSAHNIVVQIFMKSGIVGMLIYGYFYLSWGDKRNPITTILKIFALVFAMTADILEVPSRGPLLFCLMAILERWTQQSEANSGSAIERLSDPRLVKLKKSS
jgi:hypothetical protein